jgi:superfamily II DNA or RNA helicase
VDARGKLVRISLHDILDVVSIFADLAGDMKLPLRCDTTPGFRAAQLAAVHAICGHFWDKRRPALVVMPTGSGKSAVMLASSVLLRSTRVLVVAPSRLLRDQLTQNFADWKDLRTVDALDTRAPRPRVHEVTSKLSTKKAWAALRKSDVVVGTPASISPGVDGVFVPPADLFDTILFDEAHHVPARSYSAIADSFPGARQILFTATPFRRDEREIRGDLIFAYGLARARQDGVFGTLRFSPVDPSVGQSSDEAIALAAAAQLKQDRAAGFAHRLVVRASSRARADELANLYDKCTSLTLRRLHSGLSDRHVRKTVGELRAGDIDGVVAVDMLGEGFDLPELKVAALHSPHKSLAVTLQFIGRFARTTSDSTGTATFFAVANEVSGEAERLFVPGAEWNEIVEDLSRQRIAVEQEIRASVGSFGPLSDVTEVGVGEPRDAQRAQVWSLRPYFHAKVYEVRTPVNLGGELELPDGLEPLLVQHSSKENAVLWVGRTTTPPRWSTHEAWADVSHDLFLIAHAPVERLVFVCSTRRHNAVYDGLINSVTKDARRLAPNEVNRVLRGVDKQELFSLGMRNRAGVGGHGAESYRILSGRSADKAIRVGDTALYDQGHAFCRGMESGQGITIGFSSGSKVWTNRWDQVPALLKWFRAIAKKIHNAQAVPVGSMFDKLAAATHVTTLPHRIIAVDLPAEAYSKGTSLVRAGGSQAWLVDFEVETEAQTPSTADLVMRGGDLEIRVRYDIQARPQITAFDAVASSAMITDAWGRHDEPLLAFLNEHPPIFYLEDLSVVAGDTRSVAPAVDGTMIAAQIEGVDWKAANVDPSLEKPPMKKTKKGKKSVFEYVEARAAQEKAAVVFADDGSNEIADYVIVHQETERIRVQVVHCKAARNAVIPADRVDDLYEVLGQAVKCRRWLDARRMLQQVKHRAANAKGSRFLKGDLSILSILLGDVTRLVYEVMIVQPGLSTEPKETVVDLLQAADAYHRGADRLPLRLLGTRPA